MPAIDLLSSNDNMKLAELVQNRIKFSDLIGCFVENEVFLSLMLPSAFLRAPRLISDEARKQILNVVVKTGKNRYLRLLHGS